MEERNSLERVDMNEKKPGLKEKVAALSERSWKIIQAAGGIALGAVVCFFLYGDSDGGTTYSIYALILALIAPRLLEQSCGRSVTFGKTAMLVTLVVLIAAHLLLTYSGMIG